MWHAVVGLSGMLHSRLFSLVSMDVGRLTSITYCFVVVPSGAVTLKLTRVAVPAVRLTALVVQSLSLFRVVVTTGLAL
jgi:hypothetical protein